MESRQSLQRLQDEIEKELETGTLNFPTSFEVVEKIKHLFENENSALKDFSNLIQAEPLLLAKVLRLANTVSRNPSGKMTTSPFIALQRVGLNALKCLVYLVALEEFTKDTRNKEIKAMAIMIWKHSLDVGCWAYFFSLDTGVEEPDTAMLGGLLSNIGQFFLLSKIAKFPEIEPFSDLFDEILALYNKKVVEQILDILILPPEVVEAFRKETIITDIWRPTDLNALVNLGSITTELPNPYLVMTEGIKRKLFLQNLSRKQLADYNNVVSRNNPKHQSLFDTLCT